MILWDRPQVEEKIIRFKIWKQTENEMTEYQIKIDIFEQN